MSLTPEQRRAVERIGQDVCVVAGPGSGKTRVLTERFAWLVEERGIDPLRILAITFTEKAATEIKERLIRRFTGRADLREAIERAWVSTIHGFCARLLRENAIAAGLAPDFAVLDEAPARRLAREAAEQALDELFQQRPSEMRGLLEALDLSTQDDGLQPDLAASLLAVYEAMRVAGVREPLREQPAGCARKEVCQLVREILSDRTSGQTANQKIAHWKLREWAGEFLAVLPEPLRLKQFELVKKLPVNLGHLVQGSAARQAASELKNTYLPKLEAQFVGTWNQGLLDLLRAAITQLDRLYREKKRSSAALDFSDLEEQAIQLLEADPDMRRDIAGRFDHILMDELQDTNRLQWRLVNLIRRNFFAVGDINQSIYGFRHAEPAVFEEYRSELQSAGAAIDDLHENHRSRPEILDCVSRMLDGQPGIEPRALAPARKFAPTAGPVVERLSGRGEQAAAVEAGLVAARIQELVDSGERSYGDIAILVRTMASTEPFERALDRAGISFLVSGGRTFLEAREIKDLLAFLAALVNPLDEVALVGVLRSPFAALPDDEIFRLGRDGWREEFERLYGRLRPLAGFVAPDRLLAIAIDESGFATGLSDRAKANLEKLLAWVRWEHRNRPRPLAELLHDLEELRSMETEAEAPPPEAGNVVRLMSIHAAKGLEFPVVFVSALHRGPSRRKPVIAFSPTAGLGAKWRNPATGKGRSDTVHAALIEDLSRKEEAEENRLLYVAMTRAKERLFLSYVARERPSNWQKLAESAVRDVTAAEQVPELARSWIAAADTIDEVWLDPPRISGQYDSSAAVTSVALFHACPRKYFLKSVAGGQRPVDGEGTGGTALGLAVHQILAGGTGPPDAAELANRFTVSELGQRAARATQIEREFDFLLHIEDVVLRGQIDLWFEEAGELVLVDYKTDREESPQMYELQIRLYALALERYAGRLPDRAVLYYLRSDRAVEVSIAPGDFEVARATVRAFLTAQESVEFPLKAGDQCRRCPFCAGLCPATAP
jgi:ATP-dependent exoDNAse (exonuclease V) beta subunit